MSKPVHIVVICGPTAVGKTGVGIELCKRLGGEIVSADSQQVYRGMDIGTAKSDLIDAGVPYHLVDVVAPDEPFDVATFKELADKAISDIVKRGKLPVIVGGTGFYIRVLLNGICDAPGRDEDIRATLMKLKEEDGKDALYRVLEKEDPLAVKKLHPNDTSRVIRAIEVKRLTGKSITEIQSEGMSGSPQYNAVKIGLNIDRKILYERINERVDRMIENGLIKEVEGLVSRYGADIQSLKAVGYKEIAAYIKKEISLDDAISLTKQNTRHFAKRQLTWSRADPEIKWHDPVDIDEIEKALLVSQDRLQH